MKKTLLVAMDFFPAVGGISEYWERLSDTMPPRDWIVLAPELPVGVCERPASYAVYRMRFFSKWMVPRWIRLVFCIIWIARKERIRCIIAGELLPVGSAVAIACFFLGIPYMVSLHGMDLGMATRKYRKFLAAKNVLKNARMIIANSSDTILRAKQFCVVENRSVIIHPCASIPRYIPRESGGEHYPILLTVSRLVKRKGIQHCIEALSDIVKVFPTCLYIIVGGGQMRSELMQSVRSRGLEKHVQCMGIVSEQQKEEQYRKCDIFIMTPFEERGDVEGFGMVYLEANSYGKPVVGSRSGGIPDAVIDGKTGLLIEEKNSKAIADAVLRLARDPEFAHRLGAQGYERVQQEFQWRTQADKLQKILTYL